MKNLRILISGKVQGVFFRASARAEAQSLDLVGFAQNLPEGDVLIEAMGEDENIEKFLKWCHRGPKSAEVKSVKTEEISLNGYKSFDIKY